MNTNIYISPSTTGYEKFIGMYICIHKYAQRHRHFFSYSAMLTCSSISQETAHMSCSFDPNSIGLPSVVFGAGDLPSIGP
jgi:hypothetical protein